MEGAVLRGWREAKKMKTQETRLYVPFASLVTYTGNKVGNSLKIITE